MPTTGESAQKTHEEPTYTVKIVGNIWRTVFQKTLSFSLSARKVLE